MADRDRNLAEEFVRIAAEHLIAHDPFFKAYIAAEKNSQLDSLKIDGLLIAQTSAAVVIQVKGDETHVRDFYEGYRKGKKNILGCNYILAIAPDLERDAVAEFGRRLGRVARELLDNRAITAYDAYKQYWRKSPKTKKAR